MKKLFAVLSLATLVGCSSAAPGVDVTTLYRSPLLGDPVGDVIRIEDKENGVVLYKLVEGTGRAVLRLEKAKE